MEQRIIGTLLVSAGPDGFATSAQSGTYGPIHVPFSMAVDRGAEHSRSATVPNGAESA